MSVKNLIFYFFILVFLFYKIIFSQPGSYDDPVITKSYAEEFLKFKIITLSPSQKITLSGGCELVLRAGKLIAEGELLDLTEGRELKPYEKIPLNHHIISPQPGRKITADTKVIILLRGETL